MAAEINYIDPYSSGIAAVSPTDSGLIQSSNTFTQFDPANPSHYVEYIISSNDGSYRITDFNYTNYKINNLSPSNGNDPIRQEIDIDPITDLQNKGFSQGSYNVVYNFLKLELDSTISNPTYFIKEISPDRTELKIVSTNLSNEAMLVMVDAFSKKLYLPNKNFQPFYLNFGGGNIITANNIAVDTSKSQYEILINLYGTLPSQIQEKSTLWITTALADSLAFNITFNPEPVPIPSVISNQIKGPNLDLSIKDKINNSSEYFNYTTLLTTGLASSYNQILSYLGDSSLNISVDYTDFKNFVHFSSAQQRLQNFYYKVQLIEQYNASILDLELTDSASIDTNISLIQNDVTNIIKNFDGFEYYLYFDSGSNTYPKGTSVPPYDPMSSVSAEVLTWYEEQLALATSYDQNNKDSLLNTIPSYIFEDPQNAPYNVFVNMIGQHYDNIWLYYQDVSNRYNGDNRLNFGISKDLIADALRSFGLKIYQNNFTTNNLYNAFIGYDVISSASFSSSVDGNVYASSSYIVQFPEVGYFLDDTLYSPGDPNEYITNFISASQAALFTPVDDVNKEIYKRLYHNLPLLLKQKGTVAGLRNLINVYGIPDSILRISEFGGRDKDTSTYDYFYEKFNYAFTNRASTQFSSFFTLKSEWGSLDDRPEAIQFRFKTDGVPTSSIFISQSVFRIFNSSNQPSSPSLILTYTSSGYNTSSYSYPDSGSNYSPEYQYAKLDFIPNPLNYPNESASIYLPFFDNNWWSIMINRTGNNNFVLYAGNKLEYNGYDGNQIGFLVSSSVTSTSHTYGASNFFWLGRVNNFASTTFNPYSYFSGSFQELRFWTNPLNVEAFKDFVMNPSSTDVSNSEDQDYADYLAFRIPLGNELYTGSKSIHPKITGSWSITQSFSSNTSNFTYLPDSNFVPNTETFFLNSPIAGLRNRVNDKIQIVSSSYPSTNLEYTQSGNTLSQYISIQQQYPSQGSETPDVNALEVAFSPTNEIDDDIISSLGYFNIGDYIGDPRQIYNSNYPDLNNLRDTYFQKYFANYNLYDYIRLIKFFDNSLFKMIKDFVPARTNLRSGIVVKPHLLERSKYPQPKMVWEDITYTGSIDTAFITGSTGGTFNEFNYSIINPLNLTTNLSQTKGLVAFYDGFYDQNNSNPFNTYYPVPTSNPSYPKYVTNVQPISLFEFESLESGLFTATYSAPTTFYLTIVPDDPLIEVDCIIYKNGLYVDEIYGEIDTTTTFAPVNVNIVNGDQLEFKFIGSGGGIASIYIHAQAEFSKQNWLESTLGPSGSSFLIKNDQSEFYNGELPGATIEVSNGELNEDNIFKYPTTEEIRYNFILSNSEFVDIKYFLQNGGSYDPAPGAIRLWYDTGSTYTTNLAPGVK